MSALHATLIPRVPRVPRAPRVPRVADEPPMEIGRVAAELGLLPDEIEPYGHTKAKVRLEALERLAGRPEGRLVLVTAMTPTPMGEGKTTTAIGLADGLCRLGVRSIVTLRQPSLGPVFGLKGGAAGHGRSRIVPTEEVNLHLTGDFHAVAAAHNLAAAVVDSHLHHGNRLRIDPTTITWPRVVDMNDRALRRTRIAVGTPNERTAEWQITAASEVMAILALAASHRDLRRRLGRIVVARDADGREVTLERLRVAGAMAVLLRDALKPNLLQTLEGTPALIHTGPFANIAHGSSSLLADRLALRLADVVVTEAGFGADLGAEKFFDIKCRLGRLHPDAAVVVASVRGLRYHGRGRVDHPDPIAVGRGVENLARHVEIVRRFGVPCVVAINVFPSDSPAELDAAEEAAGAIGVPVAVSAHVARGAPGAEDLAASVLDAFEERAHPRPLYPLDLPLVEKIERIAREVYGADGIDLDARAASALSDLEARGYRRLPVCMAKTPLSLSHDASLLGRPGGFRLPIRDARLFAGAGFVTVHCGAIQTMPGLPEHPAAERVDLAPEGRIIGL